MPFYRKTRFVSLIIVLCLLSVYFIFRLYDHSERVNFAEDQGIILQDTFDMWHQLKPKLIGPKVSHGYDGRFFFHGPYVYYFLLPGLLFSSWNPLGGSIATIVWNSLGVVFLYLVGTKLKSRLFGIFAALIFATNPFLILYSSFVWNPNFLPFISIIFAFILLDTKKKNFNKNIFVLGLLTGIGLLLHYQMVFVLPILFGYFLYNKLFSLKKIILFFCSLCIGLIPMILFELKHDFYNIRTIYYVISNGYATSGGLPGFYFMVPIIIILILGTAIFLKKISVKNKRFFLLVLFLITVTQIFLGVKSILLPSNQLSYIEIDSAAKIIISTQVENFNIVNLTTGNTRADSLRYTLSYKGKKPLDVEKYPEADVLFVLYKDVPHVVVESDPVWEISSNKRKVVQKWRLGDSSNYYLYMLD